MKDSISFLLLFSPLISAMQTSHPRCRNPISIDARIDEITESQNYSLYSLTRTYTICHVSGCIQGIRIRANTNMTPMKTSMGNIIVICETTEGGRVLRSVQWIEESSRVGIFRFTSGDIWFFCWYRKGKTGRGRITVDMFLYWPGGCLFMSLSNLNTLENQPKNWNMNKFYSANNKTNRNSHVKNRSLSVWKKFIRNCGSWTIHSYRDSRYRFSFIIDLYGFIIENY